MDFVSTSGAAGKGQGGKGYCCEGILGASTTLQGYGIEQNRNSPGLYLSEQVRNPP